MQAQKRTRMPVERAEETKAKKETEIKKASQAEEAAEIRGILPEKEVTGRCEKNTSNMGTKRMKELRNRRCVLIGGAPIRDYAHIRKQLSADDVFLFCDGGIRHNRHLGVNVQILVGDFDSSNIGDRRRYCNAHTEIIRLPREKEDTDLFYAAKFALKRGFRHFLILGAVGGRMDHSLANLGVLEYLKMKDADARILDDHSDIRIITEKERTYLTDRYKYFSLLACFGNASGIFIKNAKYPLSDASLTSAIPYAVSNETKKGKITEIRIRQGKLLLIRSETH